MNESRSAALEPTYSDISAWRFSDISAAKLIPLRRYLTSVFDFRSTLFSYHPAFLGRNRVYERRRQPEL